MPPLEPLTVEVGLQGEKERRRKEGERRKHVERQSSNSGGQRQASSRPVTRSSARAPAEKKNEQQAAFVVPREKIETERRGDGLDLKHSTTDPTPQNFLQNRTKNATEFWRKTVSSIKPANSGSVEPTPPKSILKPTVREKPEEKKFEKPKREVRKPERLTFSAVTDKLPPVPAEVLPPKTLGEAKKSPWWPGFEEAIKQELDSLEKNETWDLVSRHDLPRGTNVLRAKFVFDIKRGPSGEFQKFKARMVAMGFTQVEGVDYDETFASAMTTKTFRVLLAIWNFDPSLFFEHWDVKTAFVNAPLKETVYVHPVAGFEKAGEEGKILRLKKALYGTKQAAHAWQQFLAQILVSSGAKRHPKDECVYIFREGEAFLFMCTHVDDLFPLFNEKGRTIRDKVLGVLRSKMQIEDRGTLNWALDTKIERDPEEGILKISQKPYIESLLKDFSMVNIKGRDTPGVGEEITEEHLPKTAEEKQEVSKLPFQRLIGKLWWLALISRPDIQCALHKCAVWQNKPSNLLWRKLMHILHYLSRTKRFGLVFVRPTLPLTQENTLYALSDSSFATEPGRKSRYGYFFFVLGGLVSWTSHNSTRIMSSSTEAECNALVQLGKENKWEREFLTYLGYLENIPPTVIYNDNTSALKLSTGGTCHKRSKHFGIEFDLFREYVSYGEIVLQHKTTDCLAADMLTKSLPPQKFTKFRDEVMGDENLQNHFQND
jgi:hypothetical protein